MQLPRPKLEATTRPALEEPGDTENQRPTAFFVIGCGGHTEARYFDLLMLGHPSVKVEPLPPGKDNLSTPRQTVDRVADFWKEFDLEEGDQVWIVLDVDQFFDPENKISTLGAVEEANSQNWRVVVSNPCFEVWMLMHTNEVLDSWNCCDDLVSYLRAKWGSYGKKRPPVEQLRPQVRDAIARGHRSANAQQMPPGNPGTQVHLLVEALDVACGADKLF